MNSKALSLRFPQRMLNHVAEILSLLFLTSAELLPLEITYKCDKCGCTWYPELPTEYNLSKFLTKAFAEMPQKKLAELRKELKEEAEKRAKQLEKFRTQGEKYRRKNKKWK